MKTDRVDFVVQYMRYIGTLAMEGSTDTIHTNCRPQMRAVWLSILLLTLLPESIIRHIRYVTISIRIIADDLWLDLLLLTKSICICKYDILATHY